MPLAGLLLNKPIAIAATIARRISAARTPPMVRAMGLCNWERRVAPAAGLLATSGAGGVRATCGPDRADVDGATALTAGIGAMFGTTG